MPGFPECSEQPSEALVTASAGGPDASPSLCWRTHIVMEWCDMGTMQARILTRWLAVPVSADMHRARGESVCVHASSRAGARPWRGVRLPLCAACSRHMFARERVVVPVQPPAGCPASWGISRRVLSAVRLASGRPAVYRQGGVLCRRLLPLHGRGARRLEGHQCSAAQQRGDALGSARLHRKGTPRHDGSWRRGVVHVARVG